MRALVCLLTFAVSLHAAFAEAWSEGSRVGGSYFVGRPGTVWVYQADKGKARLTVDRLDNWASHFHLEWGSKSVSGVWRVRDGAWVEKLAGREETVVLPAKVTVGQRWVAAPSVERGGAAKSQFEVISLDATVELPNGEPRGNCVAVLETGTDGSKPVTHYYAPNVGKVAAQGADGWLLRLTEQRVARAGGAE